jgi:hypothetical protein
MTGRITFMTTGRRRILMFVVGALYGLAVFAVSVGAAAGGHGFLSPLVASLVGCAAIPFCFASLPRSSARLRDSVLRVCWIVVLVANALFGVGFFIYDASPRGQPRLLWPFLAWIAMWVAWQIPVARRVVSPTVSETLEY